ncbi:histidine kinase [Oscillatoriales cyanobacterium USR001]|nr:histidine kinase [Oscillatoriales cyanobacterium USR001]
MNSCFLPTISEIIAESQAKDAIASSGAIGLRENSACPHAAPRLTLQLRAQQEWYAAIATLNQLLEHQRATGNSEKLPSQNSTINNQNSHQGLILSGPSSVLTNPDLVSKFAAWIFTSISQEYDAYLSSQTRHSFPLLPAPQGTISVSPLTSALPISSDDPLANEQFCLVLTATFSLVMVLGENASGHPVFLFSFDPEVVTQAWVALRLRVQDSAELLASFPECKNFTLNPLVVNNAKLDELFDKFAPIAPDYKIVMDFSRLILQNLPFAENLARQQEKSKTREFLANSKSKITNSKSLEVELLQAIAHEVRTPLATIRTLTRLLLKRPNLDSVVVKRLETIDSECTAQIDRFSLIFRAVELEMSQAKQSLIQLTAISLTQVFQSNLPRWQKQASQRHHTLEVTLPQNLPTVVSDRAMLDQVLTNLIEDFTRTLPAGSHIQVGVMLAGNQLKLQLESQLQSSNTNESNSPLKSIGPLLMFQPETGNLSLNLSVTKNLFRAAGGKLVVRQRPQKGEVMTIFLPLQ